MATKWRIKKETRGTGRVIYIPQYRYLLIWWDGAHHGRMESYRAEYADLQSAQDFIKSELASEAYENVVATSIEGE